MIEGPLRPSDVRSVRKLQQTYSPAVVGTSPRIIRKPTAPCVPYISQDQFVVNSIDRGNYGNRCSSFCSYPSSKFDYEVLDNVCLPPGQTYQSSDQYFPGRNTYRTRLDSNRGILFHPGCDLSWCPKKFWNQGPKTLPRVEMGSGPVFTDNPSYVPPSFVSEGPNILNQKSVLSDIHNTNSANGYPMGGSTQISAVVNTAHAAVELKGMESLTPPSGPVVSLGSDNIIQEEVNNGGLQVDIISPGQQDNWFRRNVRNNRYNAQKPSTNIYIRPEVTGAVPYSNSLYQTPYDTTQNVISTGKLVNTYTGELFETFENQLPPPNTTKGHIPGYQLKQINPRLLWANGGYNHHKPPPRKKEQPGYVFNPVSARGGSTAFGEQTYTGEIRKQQELINMRDLYNNRNGNQVVEPSMIGERPAGFFGLVPRFRTNPYINPTNELDMRDYTFIPENQNPDLRKREQYTGAHYARKDPVLVHQREVYPTSFVNGVQAVTLIPITTDHTGPMRSDMEQSYIGVPYLEGGGDTMPPVELNKKRLSDGRTERTVAGPAQEGAAKGVILTDHQVRATQKLEMTFPTLPVEIVNSAGVIILPSRKNKATLKGTIHQTRTAGGLRHMSNVGIVMDHINVRNTQKLTESLPLAAAPSASSQGGTVMDHINVRDTQKLEELLPVGPVSGVDGVQRGVFITDTVLKDTLKTASMENPFRTSNPEVGNTNPGDLLVNLTNLRPTLREQMQETFPVAPASGDAKAGHVILDHDLRPTWKGKDPYQRYHQGIDGQRMQVSVGHGEVSSVQVRGKCEQHYVPSVAMIPEGAHGTSARVIQPIRRPVKWSKENTVMPFGNPSPAMNIPTSNRFFPSIRPTKRSEFAYCDLQQDLDDQ
jgi:hypothetical protein